jgi:hypothetical protein
VRFLEAAHFTTPSFGFLLNKKNLFLSWPSRPLTGSNLNMLRHNVNKTVLNSYGTNDCHRIWNFRVINCNDISKDMQNFSSHGAVFWLVFVLLLTRENKSVCATVFRVQWKQHQ